MMVDGISKMIGSNEFDGALVSSYVGVGPGRYMPRDWRKLHRRTVLNAPLWRAVISLPVECRVVHSCFLQDHDTMTPLKRIKKMEVERLVRKQRA